MPNCRVSLQHPSADIPEVPNVPACRAPKFTVLNPRIFFITAQPRGFPAAPNPQNIPAGVHPQRTLVARNPNTPQVPCSAQLWGIFWSPIPKLTIKSPSLTQSGYIGVIQRLQRVYVGVIVGFYRVYIGVLFGLFRVYIRAI